MSSVELEKLPEQYKQRLREAKTDEERRLVVEELREFRRFLQEEYKVVRDEYRELRKMVIYLVALNIAPLILAVFPQIPFKPVILPAVLAAFTLILAVLYILSREAVHVYAEFAQRAKMLYRLFAVLVVDPVMEPVLLLSPGSLRKIALIGMALAVFGILITVLRLVGVIPW